MTSQASLEPPLQAFDLGRRLTAEGLGTALLLMMVIGSGIMGERLAGGNGGIALLGNTLATGAGLVVLITILGPLSGAHFNPAVTLAFALRREIAWPLAGAYVAVQLVGGVGGAWGAPPMFAGPIPGRLRFPPEATPWMVGLYIPSAYWFPASTSFANPAVTVARSLSNTFAGIRPSDVPLFMTAQAFGAVTATLLFRWLAPGLARDAQNVIVAHDPDVGSAAVQSTL